MGTLAKELAPGDVRRFQARVGRGRHSARNRINAFLSFKAGLRACEIADLDWTMVLTGDGRVNSTILVADGVPKNGRGRQLPRHPELKSAQSAAR